MKDIKRNYSIDFIKVFCTILIIFHHYQQITGLIFNNFINFFNGKIYFGYIVEFFFIISGFFMFKFEDKINEKSKFNEFIINRAKRFLPMVSIGAITYTILLIYYTQVLNLNWYGIKPSLWGTITASLGLQHGGVFKDYMVNYPTWYISVLLICYCIFFFLVKYSKKKKISTNYLYIIMILIGIGIFNYGLNLPFLNKNSARGYYSFFLGVILGDLLYKKHRLINKKTVIISTINVISIILLTAYYYEFVSSGYNFILTFLFYPSIIILLNSKYFKKLFEYNIIGKISKISYDVYIWHNPLFLVMYILINNKILNCNILSLKSMLIYTIICFIMGAISYYTIDMPIQKKLNSFKKEKKQLET